MEMEVFEYMIKFIERKFNKDSKFIDTKMSFGHDWNSMFPRDAKISMPTRDLFYMAICVACDYKQSFIPQDKMTDLTIRSFIEWLRKEDKTDGPPYLSDGPIRNAAYIIHYAIKSEKLINTKL